MDSKNERISRRDFIIAGGAMVAVSPMIPYVPGLIIRKAKAVETVVEESPSDHDQSKCRGCNVCTILYSDCRTVNNRVCWCDTSKGEGGNDH